MKDIDNCLKQISKVRSVARQEEPAYAAKSRLGRLVLTVARLVARASGGIALDRPGWLEVPTGASTDIKHLINLCNRISDTTRILVQPSEPLSEYWRARWSELIDDLDSMEEHLKQMNQSHSFEA